MKRYHYFEGKNETLEIDAKISHTNHSYSSLTGNLYSGDQTKRLNDGDEIPDRCNISGGAIGDKIVALFPEFELFNKAHLSDSDTGIPMYAVENGFYYLQIAIGMAAYNTVKENDYEYYSHVLADHLRINLSDSINLIDRIKKLPDHKQKTAFIKFVDSQKPRWKKEAEQLKKLIA